MQFGGDRMRTLKDILAAVAIVGLLSGCSSLPSSGPGQRAIVASAAIHVEGDKQSLDYMLVDLSKDLLPYFDDTVRSSLRDGFDSERGSIPEIMIGSGDVVTVSIFERKPGGLFTPESGSTANFITLPEQTVDKNGMVSVPYAGAIKVAGRPVGEAEAEIVEKLANIAIEPQVLISTKESRSNKLSILGDVNAPSEMDVSPRGERILDIIARAGGLRAPGIETYVTIERRGRRATALFRTIVEDPSENIFVRPGDTIFVNRERRTYLAFGASGLNGRFDFEEFDLTLGEALAKAGGLLDSRADPAQVFLYRLVKRKVLFEAGLAPSEGERGNVVPVIFRANLRDPSMFFAVQQFVMEDKDIIFVSNSASTELSKVLDVINGVSNTTSNLPANAVTTKNAIDELVP
jgi:polysaccharide export outer membrane protein